MGHKLIVLCFALVLQISIAANAASAAEKLDKVRFTYAPLSASGFLWFIAKDARYFEKNRLEVDMYFEGASPIMVPSLTPVKTNSPAARDLPWSPT